MKKLFLTALAFTCLTFGAKAQDLMAKNAVGIRISEGSSLGLGIAVSYQRQLGEKSRLEINLGTQTGLVYDYANLYDFRGYYQMVFNIIDKLNWYAGAGAGVQFVTYDADFVDENQTNPLIGLEGGAEYRFDFPLQVSLSVRPSYVFDSSEDDFAYGVYDNNVNVTVGVGARYTF